MFDTIRKEQVYPYSPEQVWVAITNPMALAEWLMPNDFKPVVGHEFRFQVDPMPGCGSGLVKCKVIEVDRPHRLVYTWLPVATKPGDWVRFNIHRDVAAFPEGSGTRLVLEHTGLTGAVPWWTRLMLRFGWGSMVRRMIGKVSANVSPDGTFTPAVSPREAMLPYENSAQ